MNKVVLMGRLTRDPDVRYSQDNMCVARYTLAVDRRGRDQKADFISCVAFGKAGEFADKYLRKGTKICISGRIQTGSYKNREGQTVYTTDVVAEDQEFAESKSEQNTSTAVRSAQPGGGQRYEQESLDGFMSIPDGIDEELPFN